MGTKGVHAERIFTKTLVVFGRSKTRLGDRYRTYYSFDAHYSSSSKEAQEFNYTVATAANPATAHDDSDEEAAIAALRNVC